MPKSLTEEIDPQKRGGHGVERTQTNSDGEVEIPLVEASRLYVKVVHTHSASSEEWVLLDDTNDRDVIVPIKTVNDVRFLGQVVDDETGEPVGGAQVRFARANWRAGMSLSPIPLGRASTSRLGGSWAEATTADQSGEFSAEAATFAPTEVWAFAPGYVPRRAAIFGHQLPETEPGTPSLVMRMVRPAALSIVALDLPEDVTISARFRGHDLSKMKSPYFLGADYQRLFVEAAEPDRPAAGAPEEDEDDDFRSLVIVGLPPGKRIELVAHNASDDVIWMDRACETPGPNESARVVIDLSPTGRLEGRAFRTVDGKAMPAHNKRIMLFIGERFGATRADGQVFPDWGTTTDANGFYQFDGLVTGTYAVGWMPGAEPDGCLECSASVHVRFGRGCHDPGSNASPGGWVSGKLIDADGNPIAGHVSSWEAEADSDPETGAFRIGPLPPGEVTLRASARRAGFFREAGQRGIKVGSEGVVLQVRGRGHVRGWVKDAATGKRVPGHVSLRSASTGSVMSGGGSETPFAYFAFEGLPAGDYQLWAQTIDGQASDAFHVEVKADDRPLIQHLELRPAAFLELRLAEEGDPVELLLRHESGWEQHAQASSLEPTRIVVPRGQIIVEYRHQTGPDGLPRQQAVQVREGETLPVVLEQQ